MPLSCARSPSLSDNDVFFDGDFLPGHESAPLFWAELSSQSSTQNLGRMVRDHTIQTGNPPRQWPPEPRTGHIHNHPDKGDALTEKTKIGSPIGRSFRDPQHTENQNAEITIDFVVVASRTIMYTNRMLVLSRNVPCRTSYGDRHGIPHRG